MNHELRQTLHAEKALYIPHIKSLKNKIMAVYTHNEEYEIYRFVCALRRAEFYQSRNKLLFVYYLRRSNIRGNRLGYFIAPGVLGKGVRLYHRGGIIIAGVPARKVSGGGLFFVMFLPFLRKHIFLSGGQNACSQCYCARI